MKQYNARDIVAIEKEQILTGGRRRHENFWPAVRIIALVALVIFLFGFWAGTAKSAVHYSWASWYGPGFYGNRTACGTIVRRDSMIVAHKTLRCGTRLTVCYRARCARAVVADRGPFVAGRELDLGPGIRARLQFYGVIRVRWWITS